MTPAQRIHELILCPLHKCHPGVMPRRRRTSPQALIRVIETARVKVRLWQAMHAIQRVEL